MLRLMLLAATASAAFAPAVSAQPAPAQPLPPARPAGAPAQAQPAPQPPAATPAQAPAPPTGAPARAAEPATPDTVEGVTVTGRRADFSSDIDRRSYSVSGDLQAATGSIADALRNVPQVEVDVQGNVSLRGDANVTILIDGRPSGAFTGEGRADALQNLGADQVERVEVITNPSAAFRPDGGGGVINLITKKNRRPGRYATVRGSIGSEARGNIGVSGAYTSEKLTLSADAGYRRIGSSSIFTTERERLVGAQFIDSSQIGAFENTGSVRNGRLAAEYNLDAATRVSAELRHFRFGIDFEGAERFEGEDATGAVTRAFDRTTEGGFDRSNTAAVLGWRRRFSGTEHELVADLTRERGEAGRETQASSVGIGLRPNEGFDDIRNDQVQDLTRLKVDYNRPLPGEQRLRTGFELERQENTYDNVGRRGPSRDAAPIDPNLTNQFAYDQNILAGFATYQRPFGKLQAQFGLRLEQVNIETNQLTQAKRGKNDYFRAYPTLNLRYNLDENQQLSAGYSRRTQRPNPQDLNPFRIFLDPLNLREGNPDLEPQETDSYELGYQLRKGPTYYLATLYHRESRNGVTDVVSQAQGPDVPEGALLTRRENLAERSATGLELVANGRVTPKLTYNVSANLLYEEIAPIPLFGGGLSQQRDGTSLGGRLNLNWQPTDKDFFQANAGIIGRRLQPQGYREPTATLNLGYRRKVNERLNVLLTAQDVLDSFEDVVVIDTPTLRDRTRRTGIAGGRSFFVGLSYSFSEGPKRPQREPGFDFEGPPPQ